ncbi:MAG: flagellin lysine-N-methylase [Clostridia bacterium]|nr:flagellin lysine-N-methylase [Clostridia bacterium]
MLTVYPDYYPAFRCIAGDCRHSCCIGWEIDIDEESLAKYKAMPGPLGERLRSNISAGDPPHFVLGEGERCPFLNRCNLCDLILEGGEALLCQICGDHPRFRNFLPGRTEIGLGLCCEGAAALILSRTEPVTLVAEGTDDAPDRERDALLDLRQQAFAVAQDRTLSMDARCDRLLRLCHGCEPGHPADWADVLLELERLDDTWTAMVEKLAREGKTAPIPAVTDVEWEQLLVYFLYRHFLTAWEDGDVGSKAGFAVFSLRLLRCLKGLYPQIELAELARMYSAEVEYSTENLDVLFEELMI